MTSPHFCTQDFNDCVSKPVQKFENFPEMKGPVSEYASCVCVRDYSSGQEPVQVKSNHVLYGYIGFMSTLMPRNVRIKS